MLPQHSSPYMQGLRGPFYNKKWNSGQSYPSLYQDITPTLSKMTQDSDKLCPTFQEMCNTLHKMTDSGFYPETNYLCLLLTCRSSGFLGYAALEGASCLKR